MSGIDPFHNNHIKSDPSKLKSSHYMGFKYPPASFGLGVRKVLLGLWVSPLENHTLRCCNHLPKFILIPI